MTKDVGIPVAILAGGLATRLRPLTEKIPKVMLEVGGRPFLHHQLLMLRSQGVRDIVMCVGFLGETIEDYFGDGSTYDVRIRYSFDGPVLLGTGGALRRALPLLGDAFFVLYGDSYLKVDFGLVAEAFHRHSRPALMTVFRNGNSWDTSNVHFADGKILAYDKVRRTPDMQYIDYGLSVCQPGFIKDYKDRSALDLSEVMTNLAQRGELAGYEVKERFYEIGSHAGLAELDRELATEAVRKVNTR